ncbi:MAG: AtpZ/AtpI family protein [Sphingomonadaceae bacterium]
MSNSDHDEEPDGVEDPRLTSLNERLRVVKSAEKVRIGDPGAEPPAKGYSQGNRVLAELIGGIAGGALMGWLGDRLFNTSPLLLLVCMFLGIAVAFRNIIRISGERPE